VSEPLAVAMSGPIAQVEVTYRAPDAFRGRRAPRIGLYKGWRETMPAGWTRWVLDQHGIAYDTIHDADLRQGRLNRRFDVILFQDQGPSQILDGWRPGQLPPEFTGGVGEAGVAALNEFVRGGGRLVAIESATDFVISAFDLPVSNRVASTEPSRFYIPGSILRLEVDASHPVGRGSPEQSVAWYWPTSRAFDVHDPQVRVVARYGEGEPRLSGWVLGSDRVAGQPAIVDARVGRGSIVLFGFQPNYRGQSIATWPLLFNALEPS
jgi:hypothetical protein